MNDNDRHEEEREIVWHPEIEASGHVLKGLGARSYYALGEIGAWSAGALLVIMFGGMTVRGEGWGSHPVLIIVACLLLIDALVYVPAVLIGLLLRRRREVRAGYTTMLNEFPDVDQVDSESGRVVRLAGEELLTYDKYLERMERIREAMDATRRAG